MHQKFPISLRKNISRDALNIVSTLQKREFEAYLVGGCVRDLLLGIIPKDFDVATSATPNQVKRLFHMAFIIGRRFRIVLIKRGDIQYEVTTLRGEVELLPDGSINENVFGDIKFDSARRDFTCNGLYLDPTNLKVHDYVGGVKDIKSRCLRMIGDPFERIAEDSIRLLRAIRFKNKLHFRYDEQLQDAITYHIPILSEAVRERVRLEINKMFQTGVGQQCIMELSKFGAWDKLFWPLDELYQNFPKSYQMLLDMTGLVQEDLVEPNPVLFLALLSWLPLQRELDDNDHKYRELCYPNFHDIMNSKVMKSMRHDLKATHAEILQFQQILELRPILYHEKKILPRLKAHYFKSPVFHTALDFCKLESLAGDHSMDWHHPWAEEYHNYLQRVAEVRSTQKTYGNPNSNGPQGFNRESNNRSVSYSKKNLAPIENDKGSPQENFDQQSDEIAKAPRRRRRYRKPARSNEGS